MSKIKNTNTRSLTEVRNLAYAATLLAMSIVIAVICKKTATLPFAGGCLRITFENFPIVLSGMFFGPVVGLIIGGVSDILSCIFAGSDINIIITAGAALVGFCAGLTSVFLRKRSFSMQMIASEIAGQIIGSMIVKTYGMHFYFNLPMKYLIWRVPLYIILIAIEIAVMLALYKNRYFRKIINGNKT